MGVPGIAIFGSRNPGVVCGVIANKRVFKTGKTRVSFGMAGAFRVLLLGSPPMHVFKQSHFPRKSGGGKTRKVSHPGRPTSNPALVKGFVLDVFEGFVDKAIVGAHAMLGVKVPEVLGEGDEGAHHFSLKAPQVLGALTGYVPRVGCPEERLKDAGIEYLDAVGNVCWGF